MEKVPCKDCGALILPTTAESTGGVCMACKQGIRQDIERSRSFYKKLAEYDPADEFWKSLVKRSVEDPLLTNLSAAEKTYFTVCLLEGEVYNGGFDQFFSNTSGAYYDDAASGLAEVGATNSLNILRQASEAIFGKHAPPREQSERWKTMRRNERWRPWRSRQQSLLDGLDKQFWDDPDGLSDRLTAYAEANNLIEPFKR